MRSRAVVLAALVAGVSLCGAPSSAHAGPAGAVSDVLKMVMTKSGDDMTELAAKGAAKNTDAYAVRMAQLTEWDGKAVADIIMGEAAKAGKYPRTVLEELGTYQRKLIDARFDLAEKILKNERDLGASPLVSHRLQSADEVFDDLIRHKMEGELSNELLDYIRVVVGAAKLDKAAAKFAKENGEHLPIVFQRTAGDRRDLRLLSVYLNRVKRLGGPQWHAPNGNLMSVQQNVRANKILESLKARTSDGLDEFDLHTLREARLTHKPTPFQEAVRKADPGVDVVPHRVSDRAKYGDGPDALRKEVADLSSDAARASPEQLKAAVRAAAAPLEEALSDAAIDGIERTLVRVEKLIDAVGAKAAASHMSPGEAHVFTLANKRLKDTFERFPQIRQYMPEEGRQWFTSYGGGQGKWTSPPPRAVMVDAFIKDLRAMASNAKNLAELTAAESKFQTMLSRSYSGVKPPGWFKSEVYASTYLQKHLEGAILDVRSAKQSIEYMSKQRTGRWYPNGHTGTHNTSPLSSEDLETYRLLEAAVASGN